MPNGKKEIGQGLMWLRAAIRDRKVIDFSSRVLGTHSRRPLAFPPVMKACAEEYPPEDARRSSHLTLRDFEALSLAARARLLSLDPVTDADAPAWSKNFPQMVRVSAGKIAEALVAAAQASPAGVHPPRMGLHIVGAFIDGDIDLTGLDIPFSIRLTCCAISGAVRVGRAKLVTLDLSGSALKGVFASFVETRGSVRLRRMTSTSVIDFGGARVSDVFDASDCVVFPMHDPPAEEAFVGDRGIFNLSLAELQNEMRMKRARVYGGLTLKGCRVRRSIFLDDAILRAPIAFLERVGADVVEGVGSGGSLPLAVLTAWRAELKLAKELHGNPKVSGLSKEQAIDRQTRVQFETLHEFAMPSEMFRQITHNQHLFRRLLSETTRASSTCLRADGLEITGSLFARSIRASGRLRCKYASIQGSVHLDGARFRSAQDVREGLDKILEILDRHSTPTTWPEFWRFIEQHLQLFDTPKRSSRHDEISILKREPAENLAYALDMREARIGGSVDLKPDDRIGEVHEFDSELKERIEQCVKSLPNELKAPLEEREAHIHSVYVNGQLAFAGATIGGDLDLTGILANLHNVEERDPEQPTLVEEPGNMAFLHLQNCAIDGRLDLRRSVGVRGVDAQFVRIGAGVLLAEHSARRDEFRSAALLPRGKFQFADSKIGGDATFLFDRHMGPTLLLPRSRISGRLRILPADNAWRPSEADGWKFDRGRQLRSETKKALLRAFPEIDLRSASTAEFGQPVSAWPIDDRLQIEGFIYDQSASYGPLAPEPYIQTAGDHHANRRFWRIFAVCFVLAVAALGILAFLADELFGGQNVALAAGCLTIWGCQYCIGRFSRPAKDLSFPRAIYWLDLQRSWPSVHRMSHHVIALQPYVQASKVLRAAGLVLAANHVEHKRLTLRREQLSWPNHWYVKGPLAVADLVTRYGFSPMRTVLVAVGFCALGGIAFHVGDNHNLIQPTDGSLMAVVGAGEAALFAETEECNRRNSLGRAACVDGLYPSFSSLLYALDVMVPGLELGQEQYWRPALAQTVEPLRWDREWWGDQLHFVLYMAAAPLLKIIGWLLATALAVSILSRFEAMIARHEE